MDENAFTSSGTGILTTQQRLDKIYGDDYSLTFSPNTPRGVIVSIKLPFRTLPSETTKSELAVA